MTKYLALFLLIIFMQSACKKENDNGVSNYSATPYSLNIPQGFPLPVVPSTNQTTLEGVRLGRMLYYDHILSSNGLSCSSCHVREKSFSTPLFITSNGNHVSVPPHINLAWNNEYNWNGSQPELDKLCLGDFGPEFFNTNMPTLSNALANHPVYPSLFQAAFGISRIETLPYNQLQLKIVYSISQFMRTMISSESRFDKMIRHELMFSPEEMDGYQTFVTERGDCFHCHGYPLMTSNTFNNNGLDSILTGQNLGRFLVTNNELDKGKFSVPTLRNIELTAPYMHDGRFQTLEEVVEFYNSGVHWNSPNVDPIMTKPAKQFGLNLSESQKANLVLFLKTLTDTAFINNEAYKNPH